MVDTLHCFYLGILQTHCSQVIWGLVEAGLGYPAGRPHHSSSASPGVMHATPRRIGPLVSREAPLPPTGTLHCCTGGVTLHPGHQ